MTLLTGIQVIKYIKSVQFNLPRFFSKRLLIALYISVLQKHGKDLFLYYFPALCK